MTKTPAVSVIMPVYNAGKYLRPAVASIFAQTRDDWELIGVDDASTDGSWEFLQRIDDPRVRLLRNERNMKQSYSQNRGIDVARGKWVARMDADDISLPERLEKQIAALEANPEIDVLGCGGFRVDPELRPLTVRRPPTTHAEITRWAALNFPLTHGAMVGKAEWFRKWRADPRIRLAQDFELLFRAHLDSVYGNIPDPLYVYRVVGVTRTLRQKICSVHYKTMALLRNGFRMGLYRKTLVGLASMAPRPLLYALKHAIGKGSSGLTRGQGVAYTEADVQALQKGLDIVSQVQLPLKHS